MRRKANYDSNTENRTNKGLGHSENELTANSLQIGKFVNQSCNLTQTVCKISGDRDWFKPPVSQKFMQDNTLL